MTASVAPRSTAADRVRALVKADLRVARRDGEQLLLTLGIPVFLLLLFGSVDVLPTGGAELIDFMAPGIISLALLSVAFVRLAISLGFDVGFGAIKRFGVTPLRVGEFLTAKLIVTLLLFVAQLVVLSVIAALLGWRPSVSPLVVVALVLGMVAFVGMAFVLAGVVDGLTALALANALYVVLLVLSGLVFELSRLPTFLSSLAKLFPTTALAQLLRATLSGGSTESWAWVCLALWAIAMPVLGSRLFRWG